MENIKVFVRIRPFSENERRTGNKCMEQVSEVSLKLLGPNEKNFTFDGVAGEESTQVSCLHPPSFFFQQF